MQKVMNRFWNWLFHPSIRWYHYPKGKAAWFRYPSPGNRVRKQPIQDYKSPFQYSQLNIRYKRPVQDLTMRIPGVFIGDGVGLQVLDKLKATGFLQVGENSQQQIEQAKKKYQEHFGCPVQQRVYRNDYNIQTPQGTNRQSYRQSIQSHIKSSVEQDRKLNMPNTDRNFIKNPETVNIESLDMFVGPHFQQSRIQVNYRLDNYAKNNAQRGFIQIRRGEKSFWKALDNSNDPKNIQRVQRATGDDQPLDFKLQQTKIQFQKNQKGDVVDVHPKTRSV